MFDATTSEILKRSKYLRLFGVKYNPVLPEITQNKANGETWPITKNNFLQRITYKNMECTVPLNSLIRSIM